MKERNTHVPNFSFKMKNVIKNEIKIAKNNNLKTNTSEGRHTAINKDRNFFDNILYHIFGFGSKNEEIIISERTLNKSKKEIKEKINNKYELNFIPCTNCSNLIHIEEIEKHSETCLTFKENLSQINIESMNENALIKIDDKLKKLSEHVEYLKSNSEINKDTHLLIAIHQYTLNSINLTQSNTVLALGKLITNLEILLVNFKGSSSTLVLLERTKALFIEKLNIIKEIVKKNNSGNSNYSSRKSACSRKSRTNKKDLLELLQENKKEKEKVENEKEVVKRKINSLKQTVDSDLESKSRK